MSMFYRIRGHLGFASAQAAQRHYAQLVQAVDTVFYYSADHVRLENDQIIFEENGNFIAYMAMENTKEVMATVAAQATRGQVRIEEGDNAAEIWNSYDLGPP